MLPIVRAVFRADRIDEAQRPRNLRARNHPILNVIGWAHASHRPESVLAALPKQIALLVRLGDAKLARPRRHANFADLRQLLFHRFGKSFQFNEKHRGRVARIAGMRGIFHHAHHAAVQHFNRDRSDRPGGDVRHGIGRIVDRNCR